MDAVHRPADRATPQPSALPPLLAVVGPTASGKSGLALRLAEALGGEIVNTDSLQVYRGLDIGTAKAGAAERARVRHHLLDVAAPDEPYSAGRYVDDAHAAIAGIVARGRVPILCGGTGLYYRSLLFGLADIPAVPPAVQAAVEARMAEEGLAAAHARLEAVDPLAAARIHPNDPSRIARALAVHTATGRALSHYQQARPHQAPAPMVLSLGVQWPRAELYRRIDARVRAMLAAGWLEEVRGLLSQGHDPALKPLRSIGYRELAAHVASGAQDTAQVQAALESRIAQRTRHYAKRQLTWFRGHPEIRWAGPEEGDRLLERARKFLLASGAGR